jgi:hypothetical protein
LLVLAFGSLVGLIREVYSLTKTQLGGIAYENAKNAIWAKGISSIDFSPS